MRQTKSTKVKFASATADVNLAGDAASSRFDDKSEEAPRHRPDRVRDRRQGRDGLGHRCRPAAQPAAQGGLRARRADRQSGRHDPDLLPEQNHGGWNSDDRREQQSRPVPAVVTTRAGCRRRSAAADVREILAIPAAERTPEQIGRRSSATGARRCPNGAKRTSEIEALWKEHPEGASQLVLAAHGRSRARRTSCSAAIS